MKTDDGLFVHGQAFYEKLRFRLYTHHQIAQNQIIDGFQRSHIALSDSLISWEPWEHEDNLLSFITMW